jgi:Ring finger domain
MSLSHLLCVRQGFARFWRLISPPLRTAPLPKGSDSRSRIIPSASTALPNIPLSVYYNLIPGQVAQSPSQTSAGDHGLSPSFLDTLDRVDKKTLKKDDLCAICTTPYLEDQFPLVVKLRCGHRFDLECIGIWFKEHSTCPMCRQQVEKQKPVVISDKEEEYDDTYS